MISFVNGRHGTPDYDFTEESETALGAFLVGDIQTGGDWLLSMLARLDDVRAGRSAREDWSGNSWIAEVEPDGLHLHDIYSGDWQGHYPLADAIEVMLRYWAFLTTHSSGGWKQRHLTEWEAKNSRPHPLQAAL